MIFNRKIAIRLLFFCLSFCFVSTSFSQEAYLKKSKHFVSGSMAFAFIPAGIVTEHEKYVLIVPTFSFRYNYSFASKWAIGLHTDFFLQQFEVEEGNAELTRSFPINVQVIGSYRIGNNWIIGGGGGMEFERHSSFATAALGVEYELEFRENWDLSLYGTWDYRIKEYSTFIFGIGFVRHL